MKSKKEGAAIVHKIVGILVAGGKSRRFDYRPKAFLKRDGKYFYQYSLETLQSISDSIVIVTNRDLQEVFLKEEKRFPIITDKINYKGLGPLAGIYSGMDFISGDWYAVLPVDVPFVDPIIFNQLLAYRSEQVDAVVPVVSGKIQPLFAIYRGQVKQIIWELLERRELSLQHLLNEIRVKYVTMENEQAFYNINKKLDYDKWVES